MRKRKNTRIHLLFLSAAFVVLFAVFGEVFSFSPRAFLAGLMPFETVSAESLRERYADKELRILLVPGHDNSDYGTEFKGVREADLTREVVGYLSGFLESDEHFQVFTTRDGDTGEYTPFFASYFQSEEKEVVSFREQLRTFIAEALERGQFVMRNGVLHNSAPPRVAHKLYAMNKWANENKIDAVLHIHFNDYAGRPSGKVGKYSGFTIYIPDEQFSNARASLVLAESVFRQIKKYVPVSDLTGESHGLTPDQELIAIGANGSLDGASLLLEYGYIYEPQFTKPGVRESIMRELAYQTYAGIKKYFEPEAAISETTLLPFQWNAPLKKDARTGKDVLALQAALLFEGVYPPPGKDLRECPLTGFFGECTETSVAIFQQKYSHEVLRPHGITRGTGQAGRRTLQKLQALYPHE
ncbi:MAG: N-acetylmuramoyl-L-alanine amidase [Candidatus Sungbacteria bacterium]|nr:N-acetylmuramoyl-L-alanine amidase [Candidatus Sungbacteria bacterium]